MNYRYCKTKAGIRLEEIVDEFKNTDQNCGRKVEAIMVDCHSVLNELSKIKDKRIYETIWKAWYTEEVKRINECVVPEIVRSHLMCVVKAILRNKRREYLVSHPDTTKKRRARLIAESQRHLI